MSPQTGQLFDSRKLMEIHFRISSLNSMATPSQALMTSPRSSSLIAIALFWCLYQWVKSSSNASSSTEPHSLLSLPVPLVRIRLWPFVALCLKHHLEAVSLWRVLELSLYVGFLKPNTFDKHVLNIRQGVVLDAWEWRYEKEWRVVNWRVTVSTNLL